MNEKKNISNHSLESSVKPFLENKKMIVVFLSFLCVLIYGGTLFFHFTQFDDDVLILKNMDFLRYVSNLGSVFQQTYFTYFYRPLVTLSYFIDTQIGGDAPVIFHLTNVILHILVSIFAFLVIDVLQPKRWISVAGACLLAVLPLASQTIAWIPGRTDSILAVFIMASTLMFLKYRKTHDMKYMAGHIALFICALLSNETAIVFPVVMAMYLFLDKKKESYIPFLIGWSISIVLWIALRSSAMSVLPDHAPVYSISTVLLNLRVILEVLGKAVFPVGLSALSTYSTLSAVSGIVVSIFMALLILQKKDHINKNILLLGVVWFILFMLPSLSLSVPDSTYKFDYLENHAYTALFGIILIVIELLRVWITSLQKREVIFFGGIIAIFSIVSISHSLNFKTPIDTWTHITQSSPTVADGFFQLGSMYEDSTQLAPAETCYAKAAQLNPDDIRYHNNLGTVYAKSGKYEQAAQEFFKSLALDSLNPYPYHNLGSIYYLGRNFEQAEQFWKRAIELQPDVSDPYIKLIKLYIMQQRAPDALHYSNLLKSKGVDIVQQVTQALQQPLSDSTK